MDLKIAMWGLIEGGDRIQIYLELGYILDFGGALHLYDFKCRRGRHHEVIKIRGRERKWIREIMGCLAHNHELKFQKQGDMQGVYFIEPKENLGSIWSH